MRIVAVFFGFVAAVLAFFYLRDSSSLPDPPQRERPLILTTFYPTTYFTQRIVGDFCDVECPIPVDADPIFYKPTREQISEYQRADLIVVNGAEFEKWVATSTLPKGRTVDTADDFQGSWIHFQEASTHSHGPEGDHSHTGVDGHTWLDPELAKKQCQAILEGVSEHFPEHKERFVEHYNALVRDLNGLSTALTQVSRGDRPPLLASHPAYNYLAARFEWNIENLDLDPEAMPNAKTFASIADTIARHPAKILLWESEPLAEIREKLQEDLGLQSVVFSPCEMLEPGSGDYLSVMGSNIERLRAALGK